MKKKKSSKLLSVDEIIKKARNAGVDFGSGKPYNRLRYYTKLGWIPHMRRKGKNVQGHYPKWVIERLKMIEDLKNKGLSNEEITEKVNQKEKFKSFLKPFEGLKNKSTQRKLFAILGLILIGLIILSELDIIKLGKSKEDLYPVQREITYLFP